MGAVCFVRTPAGRARRSSCAPRCPRPVLRADARHAVSGCALIGAGGLRGRARRRQCQPLRGAHRRVLRAHNGPFARGLHAPPRPRPSISRRRAAGGGRRTRRCNPGDDDPPGQGLGVRRGLRAGVGRRPTSAVGPIAQVRAAGGCARAAGPWPRGRHRRGAPTPLRRHDASEAVPLPNACRPLRGWAALARFAIHRRGAGCKRADSLAYGRSCEPAPLSRTLAAKGRGRRRAFLLIDRRLPRMPAPVLVSPRAAVARGAKCRSGAGRDPPRDASARSRGSARRSRRHRAYASRASP